MRGRPVLPNTESVLILPVLAAQVCQASQFDQFALSHWTESLMFPAHPCQVWVFGGS